MEIEVIVANENHIKYVPTILDTIEAAARRGGGLSDVAREVYDMGDIPIYGTTINPRNLINDLKTKGMVGNMLANILEWLPGQSKETVEEFGRAACDFNNWVHN